MKNVLVIGLGKVGSLVGTLLAKRFAVTGMDIRQPSSLLPFDIILGDVNDINFLEKTLADFDAVVSAMPYNLNYQLPKLPIN